MKQLAICALMAAVASGCATADRALSPAPLLVDAELSQRMRSGATPALRRELAYTLLAQSDSACEVYLTRVGTGRAGYSTLLGLASLGLSAAGGVATPASSANLFSTGAALAQGSSRTLNENLFGGRDLPILYAAVKNGRRAQRAQITDLIEAGRMDDWSAASIRTYVNAYHMDCGVNYGLQRLNEAVNGVGAR